MAPRTLLKGALARMRAEVLNVERVGIYNTFPDLGGHSLAATRPVSRVLDRFQVDVPVRSLLKSQTVADVAVVVVQRHETILST